MTYEPSGLARGRVGEFAISSRITQLAHGQYTAEARVPHGWGVGWIATDGNLTLLPDGTLHVTFPSNGITEYWRRETPPPAHIVQVVPVATAVAVSSEARGGAYAPQFAYPHQVGYSADRPQIQIQRSYSNVTPRPVKLAIRRFAENSILGSIGDLCWHWAICVGEENSCFEVNGSMAVWGPKGLIVANSPLIARITPTKVGQYQGESIRGDELKSYVGGCSHKAFRSSAGVCDLGFSTTKSDDDIKAFSKQWVANHPVYRIAGPNCQTYAEDLFTYLTGNNIPFPKSAS